MVEVRGLKFHCCRTISLKGPVWLSAQRRVNCWVRSTFGSEKRSQIRRRSFGSSNITRISCSPGWPARQPRLSPCLNADSIGCWGSSDETSTRAISSRFNHSSDVPVGLGSVALMSCFRIFELRTRTFPAQHVLPWLPRVLAESNPASICRLSFVMRFAWLRPEARSAIGRANPSRTAGRDCCMSFREQKAKSPMQMLFSVQTISSGRSGS